MLPQVLPFFGRRPLYLVSLFATAGSLLIIGILACTKINNGSRLAMAVLMIFIQLLYSTSIGPLCEWCRHPLSDVSSDLNCRLCDLWRATQLSCSFSIHRHGPFRLCIMRFHNGPNWTSIRQSNRMESGCQIGLFLARYKCGLHDLVFLASTGNWGILICGARYFVRQQGANSKVPTCHRPWYVS